MLLVWTYGTWTNGRVVIVIVKAHALYPCFISMLYIHALYPCFISMLYIHALYPCFISMLYIHALYPCFISMLYIHALYPCFISMLYIQAEMFAYIQKPSTLGDVDPNIKYVQGHTGVCMYAGVTSDLHVRWGYFGLACRLGVLRTCMNQELGKYYGYQKFYLYYND